MKRASLSILILSCMIISGVTLLPAQSWGESGRFGGRSIFSFVGPSRGPGYIGLFPVGPRSRAHSFFGGFRTGRLFDHHSRLGWGPRLWAPYSRAYRPNLMYTSKKFVEAWADRAPSVVQTASRIEQSLILDRGMSEEEVVRALGSPLQKIQLEEREVWKYSSYSLLFESGALMEIR